MDAVHQLAAGKALTLTSLPPDLQIEVFRLLPPSAVLTVCKELRQLYHDNARSVTPVEGAAAAAVLRCRTLVSLTVPRAIATWPAASLTRLRRLEIAAGWPLDQIPPALATLMVAGE